ncbi:MAG: hypothetical protein KatS3mg113_0786 [Planctomycetaceae bacterium]|nr:MAG: hypothetical protein KatS3mg113_0786 [Planctomycetaceae bacterium]
MGWNVLALWNVFKWLRPTPSTSLGAWGEEQAAGYLRRHGYRILARRFRCPLGEIDIIAIKADCVVFIEVKTSQQPQAVIGDRIYKSQQERIVRSSCYFRRLHPYLPQASRFDVVLVWASPTDDVRIVHQEAAFTI